MCVLFMYLYMYLYNTQVSARLYAFDASTHSWKERGRGDIRLNDACQRGSLFQSRLGEMHGLQPLHVLFDLSLISH